MTGPLSGTRRIPAGRNRHHLVLGLTLFLLVAAPAWAGEAVVLSPQPGSVILARGNTVHLVARLADLADRDRLRLIANDVTLLPIGIWERDHRAYAHFRIPLSPGANALSLEPGPGRFRLTYRPLRSMLTAQAQSQGAYLFHQQKPLEAECAGCHANQPAVFLPEGPLAGCDTVSTACYSCHKGLVQEPAHPHGPAANFLCRACHPDDTGSGLASFPLGRMETLCLQCHTKASGWLKQPHIHGPVGTGDCTVCHNPHADQYPFQLWADGTVDLCVACHTNKRELGLERSAAYFPHGILTGRGCTACHDPHASANRFQLLQPINDLCTACHITINSIGREHPVKGHPVEGKADPIRQGRQMSCTSCHNPHGSGFRYLLIGDALGGHVCTKCHQKTDEKPG